ncbi:protein-disulfide reductase DsbD domain-containing protein [Roseibium sediminicola]|uniref:Thiol:disulfide interchange protein DsbD N-terminal domain-containing protein n=1 Tax=Roseibium sediminicola TaxID=2933272 RepID=A0ABT0GN26_9HYPH|nr:protein-disulfide reductase DsbD domain-containing protein [Roseibium sp. CAU 1639]MCK7610736.1 hypothetical protein [Roseibium sp. CAU 1639]
MKKLVALLPLLALLLPASARAAMTDWTEVQGGAVRLIAAGPSSEGHYLAGLEFLLEPGWHTYWRAPGEAGIPPQISIDSSKNVKTLDVLYPVPERYSDGFSNSIVYHDGIVLPLLITPEAPEQTVSLSIDLFFGVCSDICVPGDAALTLDLNASMHADDLADRLIRRDLAAVPGPATSDDFRIRAVELGESGDTLRIEAEVGDHSNTDLFAAGPEGSFIGLPEPAKRSGGKAVWMLSTKGLSTTADDTTLRLVLSAGGKAIEHLEPIAPEWVK